jgi:hypothetical protein
VTLKGDEPGCSRVRFLGEAARLSCCRTLERSVKRLDVANPSDVYVCHGWPGDCFGIIRDTRPEFTQLFTAKESRPYSLASRSLPPI